MYASDPKRTSKPSHLAFLLGTSLMLAPFAVSSAAPSAKDKGSYNFSVQVSSGGQLGAQVTSMSDDLRSYFGAPAGIGLLVDQVLPDTPAAAAGLQSGDVITEVDGNAITGPHDIFQALAQRNKGDKVSLHVIRDKKARKLVATLDGTSPLHMQWGSARSGGAPSDLGPLFEKNNPFGDGFPFGKGEVFGKGDLNFDFGKDFPFGHGNKALQDKIRQLEERLNLLEGKRNPKGKGDKKTKPAPTPKGPTS